jgi:hypothetical protein
MHSTSLLTSKLEPFFHMILILHPPAGIFQLQCIFRHFLTWASASGNDWVAVSK